MKFYRMSLEAFDNLVRMLTSYLKSKCNNQVHPWLKIRKIVALVVYTFAHGISPNHVADCLKAGGFHYKEIRNIVCDILADKQKLFNQCISIQDGAQLESIISSFKTLTRLPNVANAIDGTHILLAKCPNRKVILATCNFFNKKKFHSIVLQWVCNADKIFWNVCASQLRGCMTTNGSRCPTYTRI
jgi:hypothetical protein